jgi:hypothetical protein
MSVEFGQVPGCCERGNELSVSMKCEDFLTSWGPVSLWGRPLLYGVIFKLQARVTDVVDKEIACRCLQCPCIIGEMLCSGSKYPALTRTQDGRDKHLPSPQQINKQVARHLCMHKFSSRTLHSDVSNFAYVYIVCIKRDWNRAVA